jgi:hypothetical protein
VSDVAEYDERRRGGGVERCRRSRRHERCDRGRDNDPILRIAGRCDESRFGMGRARGAVRESSRIRRIARGAEAMQSAGGGNEFDRRMSQIGGGGSSEERP